LRAMREGRVPPELARDLKKIKDKRVVEQVKQAIAQLEAADNVHDLAGLAKRWQHSGYYRLRVGDYNIGTVLEAEEVPNAGREPYRTARGSVYYKLKGLYSPAAPQAHHERRRI
jgi:mRNA interferase RelE/StbE